MNDKEHLSRAEADHDLLVRIDERTKNWEAAIKTFVTKEEHQSLHAVMKTQVSRTEFTPIKNLVYGVTALILTAVFAAIVMNVVK